MTDRPGPTPFDMAHDAIGHGCFAVDLDGHVHSFVTSVRDALIAQGVLHQDADRIWRLHWRSRTDGSDLLHDLGAWMACCDFCGVRPVSWNIPCETFALPEMPLTADGEALDAPPATSVGDWAACDPCGSAIDRGSRTELLARTHLAYGHDQVSRQWQQRLQAKFWQHYRGGAVRVPAHPFGH